MTFELSCHLTTKLIDDGVSGFSPIWLVELPLDLTVPLPLFEPDDGCKSNLDVTYTLVGEPPSWIVLNEEAREVNVIITDLAPKVKSVKVHMKASYDDVETEFSFTLYFTSESKYESDKESKYESDKETTVMTPAVNVTSTNTIDADTESSTEKAPEIRLSTFDTIAANLTEHHPLTEEV